MSVIASLLLSACMGLTPASPAGAPIKVTAGVGAFQSAPTGARFAIPLAVTVTEAEKNPVPGARVTFTAPARGPSGRFTTRTRSSPDPRPRVSHARSVTIATDACGIAVAPAFTANRLPGGYIVTATVAHLRPAAFALVNAQP